MKNKIIEIFPYDGDVELLRLRLVELQDVANLFIISDNSKNKDLEITISNNFNSFKEKTIILKDLDYVESLDVIDSILSELKLDYEDIISFSKRDSIPPIDLEHPLKHYLFFGQNICSSKIYDYNLVEQNSFSEYGSLLIFYHQFKNNRDDNFSRLKKAFQEDYYIPSIYNQLDGGKIIKKSNNLKPTTNLFSFIKNS